MVPSHDLVIVTSTSFATGRLRVLGNDFFKTLARGLSCRPGNER